MYLTKGGKESGNEAKPGKLPNPHVAWPTNERGKKKAAFPNLPRHLVFDPFQYQKCANWMVEGLGMCYKRAVLWSSCPHSKVTWQLRSPLSFSLATRCYHCPSTYLAFNCFPSFLIKGSNTQEEIVCGFNYGGRFHHSLVPPSVVDVLKFHSIYLLAS